MFDPKSPPGSDLMEQAIAWRVRLQADDANVADWQALTTWLAESPAHLAAYEHVEQLDRDIEDHADEVHLALIAQVIALPTRPRPRAPHAWKRWAIAASLLLTLGGALGLWRLARVDTHTYATGPEEQRTLSLPDGTLVTLDARTRVTTRYSDHRRQVILLDGVASFKVAHDPSRPFAVRVGDQIAQDVGTEFNVRYLDTATVITVREGQVAVSAATAPTRPAVQLMSGDRLTHKTGQADDIVHHSDPDAAFAWSKGWLVCDNETLGEIIAYANHRYRTPIRIAPHLKQQRFTGILMLSDQSALVRHLAAYLSASEERTDREIILR